MAHSHAYYGTTLTRTADIRWQCDEARPRCSACQRHDVQCSYPSSPAATTSRASPAQGARQNFGNGNQDNVGAADGDRATLEPHILDPILELRLMHEWTSQVPQSFSTAWEFWQRQAVLIAFEHRYVLDSLLCLAALHASRRGPQQWLSLEGRMAPTPASSSTQAAGHANSQEEHQAWTLPSELDGSNIADVRSRLRMDHLALDQQHGEMLRVARVYFDRAVAGQNRALPAIDAESGEACYLASICVSYAALFSLGEDQDDANSWLNDPIQWYRIAHGSRVVVSCPTTIMNGLLRAHTSVARHCLSYSANNPDNHADPPLGLLCRLGLAQVFRHILRQARYE